MPRTHGMDEYLEAIYILGAEGVTVIASILADYMGVARPTVTQTVQRLSSAGYVTHGEGKEILLTHTGTKRAEELVRRHRLLERWLTDELGLDWADAHVEAGRLEHAVSPLVEDRLYQRLGNPTTCPHGNVIPGTGVAQEVGVPLTSISSNTSVRVVRINEQAEEDLELLRFLYSAGIKPGERIQVKEANSPFEAGIPIVVSERSFALDEQVANRIMVAAD